MSISGLERYDARGVSASKEDVHAAVKNLDHGLYPKAFSKIYPDYLGGDASFVNLMSSDGTGTKAILAYLYWKETGDKSVWRGIAQDAIVMNTDDLACVGATSNFLYTSIINRNKHLIPGEVISEIIDGAKSFFELLHDQGIEVHYLGGETADLGDIVRTITVDASMTCRLPKKDLVITDQIKPGQVIVGMASFGQCNYETAYNSGIGSNGLTSARHDVLGHHIANQFSESFDPGTDQQFVYSGSKKLTDLLEGTEINVGQALLSPTRTFLPVIKAQLEAHKDAIHSIVHCTGGAQTKVLHFAEGVHVIKDNLFDTPPIFKLIQSESGTTWQEMYKVFNMGNRMELYCDAHAADSLIAIANQFGIDAQIIGRVEASETTQVTVESAHGKFIYT